MLVNQTLDAHRSLPQLWLSGEDAVTAMTEKKGSSYCGSPSIL